MGAQQGMGQPSQNDNGMDAQRMLNDVMAQIMGGGQQPGQQLQQQQKYTQDYRQAAPSQPSPMNDYFNQSKDYQMGEVMNPMDGFGGVLPPKENLDLPNLDLQNDPSTWVDNGGQPKQRVSGGAQDLSGGLNYAQQAAQGHVGPRNASDRPSDAQMMGSGNIGNPGGDDWSSLFNVTGNMSSPNMFTKMGVGYNEGGLMGALGYLLTDMNKEQPQQPKPPTY